MTTMTKEGIGISLAEVLYARVEHPDRMYSWYNITEANGTAQEGGQALDPSIFFYQQVVTNNLAVCALTLYIWEWLSTLPDEFRLYTTHKLRSRHVLLFVLVRYGTIPSLILPAYSVWHNFTSDMGRCLVHQQLAICVVQLIVSIVFAWRTIAIWDHQRKVIIFFIAIVCIQFGASFGLLWFSEEKILPNGSCMPVTPINGFNPLPTFYAVAFFYDLLTILMSSYKLWKFSNLGRQKRQEVDMKAAAAGRSLERNVAFGSRVKQSYKGMIESPLIHRLTYSGLVYFVIATAFNAIAFALEVSKNVHSKALITLYAPLMCITCQRIILLDVKTIWGDLDRHSGGNGNREQALVDRVMNEGRLSWQGIEDRSIKSPQLHSHDEKERQHVTLDMEPTIPGVMGLEDMLQNSSETALGITNPSQESSTSSSIKAIDASTDTSMSNDRRATALRLAGFIK